MKAPRSAREIFEDVDGFVHATLQPHEIRLPPESPQEKVADVSREKLLEVEGHGARKTRLGNAKFRRSHGAFERTSFERRQTMVAHFAPCQWIVLTGSAIVDDDIIRVVDGGEPGGGDEDVSHVIDGDQVGDCLGVAVHRPQEAASDRREHTSRTVEIVHPSREGLLSAATDDRRTNDCKW